MQSSEWKRWFFLNDLPCESSVLSVRGSFGKIHSTTVRYDTLDIFFTTLTTILMWYMDGMLVLIPTKCVAGIV